MVRCLLPDSLPRIGHDSGWFWAAVLSLRLWRWARLPWADTQKGTDMAKLAKSAWDGSHVKSVTAWALTCGGIEAGRVVANWSDNPAGSVCTATVVFFSGKLQAISSTSGRAGGYGYCKFSSAVWDAIDRAKKADPRLDSIELTDFNGAGESAVCAWLESNGYKAIRVIG